MGGDSDRISSAEAASTLGWWIEAGVDIAIAEIPRKWREALQPVSPTSTNPEAVMRVARLLREHAAAGGAAIIDEDSAYRDVQLAFFSGLPELRLARYRWDTFRERVGENQPRLLVRFDGGRLEKDAGVKLEGRVLTLDGLEYDELEGFEAPLHVYRRRR